MEDRLGENLEERLDGCLREVLWDSIGSRRRDMFRNSLGRNLRATLDASLWTSFWHSLRDSLKEDAATEKDNPVKER
jgi:hypothetical protein